MHEPRLGGQRHIAFERVHTTFVAPLRHHLAALHRGERVGDRRHPEQSAEPLVEAFGDGAAKHVRLVHSPLARTNLQQVLPAIVRRIEAHQVHVFSVGVMTHPDLQRAVAHAFQEHGQGASGILALEHRRREGDLSSETAAAPSTVRQAIRGSAWHSRTRSRKTVPGPSRFRETAWSAARSRRRTGTSHRSHRCRRAGCSAVRAALLADWRRAAGWRRAALAGSRLPQSAEGSPAPARRRWPSGTARVRGGPGPASRRASIRRSRSSWARARRTRCATLRQRSGCRSRRWCR